MTHNDLLKVNALLATYVVALRDVVSEQSVRPIYYVPDIATVRTVADGEAVRLPNTNTAIRGLRGTSAATSTTPGNRVAAASLSGRLTEFIIAGLPTAGNYSEPPTEAVLRLRSAHAALFEGIREAGDLAGRIYEANGYKTYDGEESLQRARSSTEYADITQGLFLAHLFAQCLVDIDPSRVPAENFGSWDALAEAAASQLELFAAREVNRYYAIAFANGPLFDGLDEQDLIALPSPLGRLTIKQASDDLLAECFGNSTSAQLPVGIADANVAMVLELFVPVLGTVEEYNALYPMASNAMARAMDVLRIVCGGDIGVTFLTIRARDSLTPIVRETYHAVFNSALAAYIPRRAAFSMEGYSTLTDAQLAEVRYLIAEHDGRERSPGFTVALQRFRDVSERHWPGSPERVLDAAIAFEALLLGDDSTKELRFRLALRGARWLAEPGPDREAIFEDLRTLYDVRSKIAHGTSLENASQRERREITIAMSVSDVLLRRAFRRILEGHGPEGRSGDQVRSWWRRVELA